MPEVALEAIGLVGVGGDHPAEEDVLAALTRMLEEALSQVDVVPTDALVHAPALPDGLQEVDAGKTRRDGARDVGFRQPNRGLDARRGRKVGKKRRLGRIGLELLKPWPPVSSQLGRL